ncbi:hypothetical protein BJP25_11895 [Actinokineospora bangkokensis]|uniref:ABC transporter permease n=1 Tax=Actinokineospora bangkokensis TaxID=1193682 RepID=A0A1Q9LR01_9PSEU|nr:hypothetical protein BJP25_11895 [Actinokineospora bangkokensis]
MLLRLFLRRSRSSTLAWTTGLFALTALQLSAYPAVHSVAADLVRLLDDYPPALRSVFDLDTDFATGAGYLRAELFSLTAPLMLIGLAISQASAATAVDERAGHLEFLLVNPVPRASLLAARGAAVLIDVAVAAIVLATTVLVGCVMTGLDVGAAGVLAAVSTTTLIAVLFAAVAFAVGAATARRGAATAAATGLALLTYLVNALGDRVGWLHPWRVLSPFAAAPGRALTEGLPVLPCLLVAAVAALAGTAAVTAFGRRDLGV